MCRWILKGDLSVVEGARICLSWEEKRRVEGVRAEIEVVEEMRGREPLDMKERIMVFFEMRVPWMLLIETN